MTTTNTLVEEVLDPRQANIQIARFLGTVCTLILASISIWLAVSLLDWAMDKRELASSEVSGPTTEITAAMREKQLACLSRNIYYEAGGEPFEGKVAVAQVTMNRAKSSAFPDDICQVIYQKSIIYSKVVCQFSWVCQSAPSVKPVNGARFKESEEVAKKVLLEGFRLPSLKDALYFHGDYINPGWGKKPVAHIGRHIFYN